MQGAGHRAFLFRGVFCTWCVCVYVRVCRVRSVACEYVLVIVVKACIRVRRVRGVACEYVLVVVVKSMH